MGVGCGVCVCVCVWGVGGVFAGSLLLSWDIPFRGCTKRRNRGRVCGEQKYIRTFYGNTAKTMPAGLMMMA